MSEMLGSVGKGAEAEAEETQGRGRESGDAAAQKRRRETRKKGSQKQGDTQNRPKKEERRGVGMASSLIFAGSGRVGFRKCELGSGRV